MILNSTDITPERQAQAQATAVCLPLPALPPGPEVAGMSGEALAHRVAASAKCAGDSDEATWFPAPIRGHSARAKFAAHARAACLGCPVTGECLELALRTEPVKGAHGVRGATAPWERQEMIRTRRSGMAVAS
jgi:hypothetical protein